MRNIIILVVLLLYPFFNNSQNLPDVESKKGVYITNEDLKIILNGDKLGFINYVFQKTITYKIISEKGVKALSHFILPQFVDPTYISHASEIRNIGNFYINTRLNRFASIIKRENGEIIDSVYQQKVKLERTTLTSNKFYDIEIYDFFSNQINIGDEITIDYTLTVPYVANFSRLTSMRIFFHDSLYKQNYKLTLSHDDDLLANISFFNKGEPDSSYYSNKRTYYTWKKKSLAGCINEEGALPYKDLPNFTFSIKPLELLYTLPYSFEKKFLPYFVLPIIEREEGHLELFTSMTQGVKTKQFSQIHKFVEEQIKGVENDTSGLLKIQKIHNYLTSDFKYQDDKSFFIGNDIREERIGDFLSAKTIREISRYKVYIAILAKLEIPYFTCYLSDKRIGEISDYLIAPMFDSDYLITPVINQNQIHFLYPKNNQFGFYFDELPFYFENVKCRLISLNDYMDFKKPVSEKKRYVYTPSSGIADNYRKCDVLVNVDLDSLKCFFKSKVQLSGQYSTITRGLYKYNYKLNHINQDYNKKVWEINGCDNPLKFQITKEESIFPFKFGFTADYASQKLLTINDKTYTLKCSDFFKHITSKNLDSLSRQMDFCSDFKGTDTYTYFIQFNNPINPNNLPINIKIENTFGIYEFTAEQIKPDVVKIQSYLSVTGNKVDKTYISFAQKIFEAIYNFNNLEIEFSKSKTIEEKE